MARFEMTQFIEAPVERVFQLASDVPNCHQRISGIVRVEMLTDGPIGVGARWRETRRFGKHEAVETLSMIEFEPNRRYTVACNSCGCAYRTTFHFQPAGRGTNVRLEMDARPVTLFARVLSPITGLIFGPMMKKCMRKDLEDLKSAAQK
ncbi:MAG: hypothetical protein C4547_08250 [Phycisphaerales bacterium]|nr:MAG: hypothetical protein C4547_08250 [Phycisphaerales bacterium]